MAITRYFWQICAVAGTLAGATTGFADETSPEPAAEVGAATVTTSGDPFGDEVGPGLGIRSLVQTRYMQTWPTSSRTGERDLSQANDGWTLNRAFVRIAGQVSPELSGRFMFDFADLQRNNTVRAIKFAYAQWAPSSRVKVTAGLFKRLFSLLELLPIADYEFADTGLGDTLIKDTGFGGRDIGAEVSIRPLAKKRWLKMQLAAYQGGHVGSDSRVDGLINGRLESTPIKNLHLGADLAWRRRATTLGNQTADGQQDAGWAWSADAMWQKKHYEIRGEVLGGDRTDIAYRHNPETGQDARKFLGWWLLAVAKVPLGKTILLPAARVEWLDVDRDKPVGAHWLSSAALNLDISANLRFLVDFTVHRVQAGTMPLSQVPQGAADQGGVWLPFHDVNDTRATVQIQAKI